MDKLKPFETIAARFQISRESAKYFLGHVQKSFKKENPPQQLIVEFMAGKKFEALPKPHQVAALMNASCVWAYPLNAEPPVPADEKDVYF
jgi:hypothetical protein